MGQHLGQHFLQSEEVKEEIIGALEISGRAAVIEVGAGHGELTDELVKKASHVYAIEKDPSLADFLEEKFRVIKNITIICGDVRTCLIPLTEKLNNTPYILAGNIPYYLTGQLIRTLGELNNKPQRIVLMVQKEVAQRLCATPPEMNKLAAAVQFWAEASILSTVFKKMFSPPPKVDSALILFVPRIKFKILPKKFYHTVRILFAQPRKTLLNNIMAGGYERETIKKAAEYAGTDPALRPQNLTLSQIVRIAEFLSD